MRLAYPAPRRYDWYTMGSKRYVALLRGIDVGGRNLIPMAVRTWTTATKLLALLED